MDPNTPNLNGHNSETATSHTVHEPAPAIPQPGSNNLSTSPPGFSNTSLPPNDNSVVANIIIQPKTAPNSTSSVVNANNPRLRSSIACARCRKSKIKCTNAGAGTPCEACTHSGRECVYPIPGVGGIKREGEDDTSDRPKRPRVRKSEPMSDKINISYTYAPNDHNRSQSRPQSHTQFAIKLNSSQAAPAISGRVWAEVFELFQLHYGTELSFLHAPTFLPKLADDPAMYAAMTGQRADSTSLRLLQLGILTLTARHHEGLSRQYSQVLQKGSNQSPSLAASEYFAVTLEGLLFNEDSSSTTSTLETSSLARVQALLMLSLYEWSVQRGRSAWIYLGIAVRMAQVGSILTEDLDIPTANSNPWTGPMSTTLSQASTNLHDLESAETFVNEEAIRRTAWSCFILDRYFSNGATKPISMDTDKMFVQMPCGEKAWAFGDRVCTPFFNGNCSQHKDRVRRKFEHAKRTDHDADDHASSSSMISSAISRIPCEYEQDEGLISRYIRVVDLWGEIARWSYQGGKTSGLYAPWDDRSRYWSLKNELQKFADEMPRSFRFTKANSQAHLTQHTSPAFTLLHTVYSICKLTMLREFLPFCPVMITSPSHLDEIEIREPNIYNRRWHSNTLKELFKVAHDLLDLIHTCKSRSMLSSGPMMGFGIYLASFIGIYALHFPQMDTEGLVFSQDLDPNSASERQVRIAEAIRFLASTRAQLPMADHWFRTLHRAHRYYRQFKPDTTSKQFPAVNRNSPSSDEKADPSRTLDHIFKELGTTEDENITFAVSGEELWRPVEKVAERALSPQPLWKPVNTTSPALRHIDPLDRPAPLVGPQAHAKWYQARGDPADPSKGSPGFDKSSPYTLPPNTLPPINSASSGNGLHAYPPTPPSVPPSKSPASDMVLSFSGGDVAMFIDARNNKDLATIKDSWSLLKTEKSNGIVSTSTHRAQDIRRMKNISAGWVGLLWQWI